MAQMIILQRSWMLPLCCLMACSTDSDMVFFLIGVTRMEKGKFSPLE